MSDLKKGSFAYSLHETADKINREKGEKQAKATYNRIKELCQKEADSGRYFCVIKDDTIDHDLKPIFQINQNSHKYLIETITEMAKIDGLRFEKTPGGGTFDTDCYRIEW